MAAGCGTPPPLTAPDSALPQECAQLAQALEAAQLETRDAEFGKAKAEALATARGQALTRSQRVLREAEAAQGQLNDMLRMAMSQLGIHVPSPQSEYAPQRRPVARSPAPASMLSPPAAARPASAANSSQQGTPPQGFTVYSNSLSGTPAAARSCIDDDDAVSTASETKWRDISEVVVAQSPASTATVTPPYSMALMGGCGSAVTAEEQAQRLAHLIIPHLDADQLETLVNMGASMASPPLARAPPATRQHLREATAQGAQPAEQAVQKQATQKLEPQTRPLAPHAEPARQSQQQQLAAAWTSPPRQAPAGPLQTLLQETEFYSPFAQGIQQPEQPKAQPPAAHQAPAPRRSTFTLGTIPAADSGANALIKAVQPRSRSDTAHAEAVTVAGPEDEATARQRRAAERIAQKLNNKLAPEHRRADPLGLIIGEDPLQYQKSAALLGGGGLSGKKLSPKGSLRRRAEAVAATPPRRAT